MPTLIELLQHGGPTVEKYTIEQIVAICGDGKLRDNSEASDQLRQFLSQRSTAQLEVYAQYCLEEKFDRSGLVLQDVINEIGRRLGYQVQNGRYRGAQNQIGFDGLWFDGSAYLVVEVKTTDAYRVNLDTICEYGEKLKDNHVGSDKKINTLVVVGRQDTGDLEAQVRGSRHAWSVRIISIDSLVKLMFLHEELDDPKLVNQIRTILHPFEYTRVDNIIDMLFDTQKEADEVLTEPPAIVPQERYENLPTKQKKFTAELTPKAELEAKRYSIVKAFFALKGSQAHKKSKTNFSDLAGDLRVTCAVSKRYDNDYQPYWYALHPAWVEFLKEGKQSFFVLGCMDRTDAYAVPFSKVAELLPNLNQTEKGDRSYWHVALNLDDGILKWNVSQIGLKLSLDEYRFSVLGPRS